MLCCRDQIFINFISFILQNHSSHTTLNRVKYFQGILILASVLFDLYREALVVMLAGRRLPRMQEVVGSNPTEGKICFSFYSI